MKHKLIRLTESDLHNIVEETINTTLRDYSKIRKNANFMNPISRGMKHPLTEGLIRTYPLETTIRYIKDYFDLSDEDIYPIDAYNGREQIAIKVPIVGNNLELIKKAFALCGYYLGYPKEDTLKQGATYELQFEKKNEDEITEMLREKEKVIYHITPAYYVDKIKHIGLTPKSKNSQFDYPSRVYFIPGSAKTLIRHLLPQLDDANKSKANQGYYAIITLELAKIPKHVRFFLDANALASVYTNDNIPPTAITNIELIDVYENE